MKWPIIILPIFLLSIFVITSRNKTKSSPVQQIVSSVITIPTPTPIQTYYPPTLETKDSYTLLFIGDSMTKALGENFDQLGIYLKAHYPHTTFGLFNYSEGATNILTINQRLTQDSTFFNKTFPPILSRQSDIVILESFGHNPLSQYPLQEGLDRQTKALDQFVQQLVINKPQTLIIFLATIAPSKTHYALQSRDLSPDVRQSWAQERIAYIENHINYAKSHNIPLINVYEKSLDSRNQAILRYINSNDYIHPSKEGVQLISAQIADYLFTNHIIPVSQ